MAEKEKIKYSGVGGEALIEGIMMKGPKGASMACRMPDGTIDVEKKEFNSVLDKYKFLKTPFIRGPIAFVEQMIFGYKCMMESAEKTGFDTEEANEEEMSKLDKWLTDHFGPKMMNVIGVLSMILGLGIAFVIFILIPIKLTDLINKATGGNLGSLRALIEGLMRVVIFVAYMASVSLMKDIKRVFMYHGAEHKTIFCIEHGLSLTVENVRKQIRFHPRCGTSFIFITIILSIAVSSIVLAFFPGVRDIKPLWVAIKILLLPVIMSLGYECIRLAGKYDNIFTRILSFPGLMMQRITTKEPTDDIIEVAIAAVREVIDVNVDEDKAPEDVTDERPVEITDDAGC